METAASPPTSPPKEEASTGVSTVQCAYCQTQLSYPENSLYIQCPKCKNTMNPQQPHINFIHCIGCTTLLSHPPSSLTIQCPKCLVVMELPQIRSHSSSPSIPNQSISRKQRKKRKDPNAPKRYSNAYMIFCKERRARLKEERPDLPFGQLGAKLGEMWRDLSNEEKKPYELQASMDRDRYKKAMHSYSSGLLAEGQLDGEDDEEAEETADTGQSISNSSTSENPSATNGHMSRGERVPDVKRQKTEGGDDSASDLTYTNGSTETQTNHLLNLALHTDLMVKQEEEEEEDEHDDDDDDDDDDEDDEGDEGDDDEDED